MVVSGIDLGTQSLKTLVYDSDEKRVLALESAKIDLISEEGGVREQKASWWIEALLSTFSRIDRKIKERIEAIGVSGQQHGFVPISESGEVLSNVKLWCDTSTSSYSEELIEKYGGSSKLIEELGNTIMPGYTLGKIYYFIKEHRDLYDRMRYVLLPHDYLNYYLTGRAVMEMGDASGTGLLDVRRGLWSKELSDLADPSLFERLPELRSENSIIGIVSKEAQRALGLKEGVMVSSGGGDNMMAAIGTGTVDNGSVTMSLGTSGTLFASSDSPIIDKSGIMAAFRSSHGTFLPLLCTMNCTVSTEIFRSLFSLSVKEFDSIAESSPIGAEGILVLPFYNGERIPNYPNGKGVIAGITNSNLKRENIARASIEGPSFEFLLGLSTLEELGLKAKTITLAGGGAKSRFWRSLISDMTSIEVRVPVIEESAAFGAALQALSEAEDRSISSVVRENVEFDDTKSAKPNYGNTEKYRKVYNEWLKYVKALGPIFS